MKTRPKILFLVHDDYAGLKAKGVAHMILERDENGFFEKVFTVHPLARVNQTLRLNDRHILYEFNLRECFYPNKLGMLLPLLPVKFFLLIPQLVRLIREEQIDIIRATDPYLMGLIAWILSRLTGRPFCISIHSDYEMVFSLTPAAGFKHWLRVCSRWIPDFVSPRAHLMLPISQYIKKVVSKKVEGEKIKVIPHGVDFNFYPIKNLPEIFNIPTNKKIISYVARLSKDNYIDDILEMVEKLSQRRNDFLLVMVGGGELESYIKNWISLHPKTQAFIRILGFQSNEIGRSFRYISDISLCLMSGFSLIEAAAAANPLISYDVEWHGELVENGKTGFLIKEHDVEALVNSVSYLLDHPNEAKVMGENAKEKAFQHHEIQKTSSLKQRYYLELLKT